MARLPNGILGEFIGRAGNMSGYMRNGQNIVRTRRSIQTKPPTAKQLAQQQKISICNLFTKAFTGTAFFKRSFPAHGHTGSGFNRATRALLNLAITGTYANFTLTYTMVLISKGPNPGAENAHTVADNTGNIIFSWDNNTGTGTARSNDKTIFVAFFPIDSEVIFSFGEAMRQDGQAMLNTSKLEGKTAETWIEFLSNDEADASNSLYTGNIFVIVYTKN